MEVGRILPTEAAVILNVSPQFIRIAMQQGKLPIGTAVQRVILIRLTDAGRAAYLAEHEHIAGILSQLIDTLGEDRARALTDGINEAVSALEHIV